MSSIPTSSGADCMRAWESMPAVLQERASPQQGEWLKRHVAVCSSCREEFEQQGRLRLALSLPTDLPLDAQRGLRRLLDRIAAAERQAIPTPLPSRAGWLQRGMLAAVIIQGLGLSVVAAKLWSVDPAPAYRTLSEEPVTAPAGTIRVVPDAAMALTDWNALLHVLRLRVVGGPDAAGAYIVAPMNSTATTPHLLQQLRATHGVRLAEAIRVAR
jgi:hypothetical protein